MIRQMFSACLFVLLAGCAGKTPYAQNNDPAQKMGAKEAVELVSFQSKEGQRRLVFSHHKRDFFPLVNQFEAQSNKIFCGAASAAITLNALFTNELRNGSKTLVLDKGLIKDDLRTHLREGVPAVFNRYSQNNVFWLKDVSLNPIKPQKEVLGAPQKETGKADWGFQLRQLHELFMAQGANSTLRIVTEDLNADDIRKEIIANLVRPDDFVVINYARKSLGQKGGGHISPIGAYHAPSDSFLVLDVNPMKDDWVWVSAVDLIAAMQTFDTVENRGYLLVSKN